MDRNDRILITGLGILAVSSLAVSGQFANPDPSKSWVYAYQTLVAGTLALIAAGIGAYLAWQTLHTERDKARLEIFDARREAYRRLRDAVAPVTASGKVKDEDVNAFIRAMDNMHHLFNRAIEQEAREIYEAMLKKQALDLQLDGLADKQKALLKSNELFARVMKGVYHTIPEQMDKLMRLRSIS